jgi:dTDP-4-amino-4,6-dideoxygalactose transaminase
MSFIPLHKIFLTGEELIHIQQTINNRAIAADGFFTEQVENYFQNKFNFKKCLLTSSATAALEMSALLLDIKNDDEIIVPSFTFSSTVNAFLLRGAKIIFVDSEPNHPNISVEEIEKKITSKTKAIVVMHYAGMACQMASVADLANQKNIFLIEDAAQCVGSFYNEKSLGSFGDFSAFSFHATKNITCGEGGMLVLNDKKFIERAEIIREKGTNKKKFSRNEIDKYEWVDMGSSFLMSELNAAFLFAQIHQLEKINSARISIWDKYFSMLQPLASKGFFQLPQVEKFMNHNAHIFYLECRNEMERNELIQFLKAKNIASAFHYSPLHESKFYVENNPKLNLPNASKWSSCLLRLPLFVEMTDDEINKVVDTIHLFFKK